MTILLSGGSGRLGSELQKLIDGIIAPSHEEFDVTKLSAVDLNIELYQPDLIVHAAAYTDVARAETEKRDCWQTNVLGTKNIVKAANKRGIALVYISTDYVFYGDKGNYREDDIPGPVRNYYSLTKLVAEELVQTLDDYLIIRTSFRPREWAYEKAFYDLYTSQDYIDIIAPELAKAIVNYDNIEAKILHIATDKKSTYELAKRRKTDVIRASKNGLELNLPEDISLNSELWQSLKEKHGF